MHIFGNIYSLFLHTFKGLTCAPYLRSVLITTETDSPMTWFKIDSITFVKAHTETGAICIFRLDHVRLAKPTSGSSGTTLYFGANMWVNIQEPFNEY